VLIFEPESAPDVALASQTHDAGATVKSSLRL